ncbi:Transcriptional regulator, GntR family [Peptoniphilus sp. ING2-D1G]|nr:Transcriptional regulator, GntR family [Peptoniphilus sp. ING2-D1G]
MVSINIIFSKDNKIPLYQQIVESIRSEIMKNNLKSGDKLPSIRVLSDTLEVSLITVKKAYDELENLGLITIIYGKGSYVSEQNVDSIRENQLLLIEKELEKILNSAKEYGIDKETLIEIIKLL